MSTSTGAPAAQTTITLSAADLEQMIRRVVREEIGHALRAVAPNPMDDLSHEGPDDPAGDAILLKEALEAIEHYKAHPEDLMSLEDFEAELEQAEAAGELPG